MGAGSPFRWSGRLSAVTDNIDDPADAAGRAPDLETLVGEWLTVPEIGERLGLPLAKVRLLIEDRFVLSARIGGRNVVAVPARFFDEDGPRSDLRGTFTVLADSGLDDSQILRWLFTPDPTLPVPGAPIDALVAGHKTEIRRRAMELAF